MDFFVNNDILKLKLDRFILDKREILKVEDMKIREISIHNFKSLYNFSFEPGRLNVFIGANGSGKSSVLEALGVLSAAMTDRVNTNSLQRKGVRLSTSALYKSKFSFIEKESKTVDLEIKWSKKENYYKYSTHLTVPSDDDSW